ncbi:MAG: Y-family DNA polymerase [Muribaculaceae bacterium]|nr:Y-family DNA polymerase [Muribaculaceae bacterium]
MIGIVDCNNFFVSCERVMHPELANRPVVVLSNNDGCIVAMSNEAKAIGLTRGMPLFKARDIVKAHNVQTLSGNHRLYGEISTRVMATLKTIADDIEVYSIDEAFITFNNITNGYDDLGRYIVQTVHENTGIPVSVGFAATKTMAKIAAHFAKKYPGYKGTCVIDTPEKARKALEMTNIGSVWGIGRRHRARLEECGIRTAAQFADLPLEQIKGMFSVIGERTWRELHLQPCIDREILTQQKTLSSSRSFAHDIYDWEQIRQATIAFASILARKLRSNNNYALELSVFIQTNRFHQREPQYYNTCVRPLPEASCDTIVIATEAQNAMKTIFRKGLGYKKAGVTITKIINHQGVIHSLFADPKEINRREILMKTLDEINKNTASTARLRIASEGQGLSELVNGLAP